MTTTSSGDLSSSPAPARGETTARLLAWYRRAARDLPWRVRAPARPDPYRVWLSEIMLQQTTVVAVVPYFQAFCARWPRVQDLAAAPLEDVLAAWAGLGYYARARNLHACARAVCRDHGGRFPADEAVLRTLPGIGPYTAAAIAAIAFGRRAVVVDGNVERAIARLFALETPLPALKSQIRPRVEALLPAAGETSFAYGDFAQAMMDLGATVCLPARPRCDVCPVAGACLARAAGTAAALPRRTARKARPVRHGVAFWLTDPHGAVLLCRRRSRGLLGGMMALPSTEWRARPWHREEVLAQVPVPGPWRALDGVVRHTFTHFHLELAVWAAVLEEERPPRGLMPGRAGSDSEVRWVRLDDLGTVGLPSLMHKAVAHALARGADDPERQD
ncbi:MAG: A/G-specific adenine glycosylase [Alphaproteobacteria bacterium]|nr:MAG: A/G-specific adenine glycosylase [Alphaproteobacteria bacterium]